jgi:hypothetical protein
MASNADHPLAGYAASVMPMSAGLGSILIPTPRRPGPHQRGQSVTPTATPNAGSALGVNPVTGRVGRHYAWPSSGPSPATIGALVQVAGMVSDTNREPRPSSGNRRSGVLNVRPDRSDRAISRPLAGVSRRPSAVPDIDPQAGSEDWIGR